MFVTEYSGDCVNMYELQGKLTKSVGSRVDYGSNGSHKWMGHGSWLRDP